MIAFPAHDRTRLAWLLRYARLKGGSAPTYRVLPLAEEA